jgi:hypothetical protein
MALARRELKKKQNVNSKLSIEEELEKQAQLEKLFQEAKRKEKEAKEAQDQIEYRALHGMDGPRPCMFMNGKRI